MAPSDYCLNYTYPTKEDPFIGSFGGGLYPYYKIIYDEKFNILDLNNPNLNESKKIFAIKLDSNLNYCNEKEEYAIIRKKNEIEIIKRYDSNIKGIGLQNKFQYYKIDKNNNWFLSDKSILSNSSIINKNKIPNLEKLEFLLSFYSRNEKIF